MPARKHFVMLCVLAAAPHATVAWAPGAGAGRIALPASRRVAVSASPKSPKVLPGCWLASARGLAGKQESGAPLFAMSLDTPVAETKNRKGPVYGEFPVNSEREFDELLAGGKELTQLRVEGAVTGSNVRTDHPVLNVLRERRANGSKPGKRDDGHKVALVIEGGGMRGSVSAGMVSAVMDLGFGDAFDGVFGSSAGSLVGAYFVGAQEGMPQYGCSLYYDLLTDGLAKDNFIDRSQSLPLLGLRMLRWFTLRPLKEALGLRAKRPLLNLEYLLKDCVEEMRPLDWERFWERNKGMPLHVMASDLTKERSIVLDASGGHFSSMREMTKCIAASMCLPAVAGDLAQVPSVEGLLADAQLYEPIPYRSAFEMGYTHALVLRTRPDGANVVPKKSWSEQTMMRRFFSRKYDLPAVGEYLATQKHKELYARDILRLNALNSGAPAGAQQACTIALDTGVSEVARIERSRPVIFEGVRSGYKAAFTLLSDDEGADAATDRALPLDAIAEAPELSPDAWLERYRKPHSG